VPRNEEGVMYYKLFMSALLIAMLPVATACAVQKVPITGTAVPEFVALDQGILDFMKLIGCQAVTLAISKDDELVYSRGYGWRDAFRKQPTQPDTIMRIGFATKAITAAAVRTLVGEDKLTLDTKAFEYLKIATPPGMKSDPRLANITVEHLLADKGGWDRQETFDPMSKCREIEQ
jgi:CubicO group peptidase (beta-lactamase class C family)